jgi:drug/metabolite transporter (DMT)-like permease
VIDWLAPALGFALTQGALGVTTKLALRSIGWPQLLLCTAAAYALLAAALAAVADASLPFEHGSGWALASGLLAAVGLGVFFVALGRGPASRVVPVTAAYPVTSAILAAAFLSESITGLRVLGIGLVVGGIAMLGRE